jgi:hypothetical protein
LSWEKSRREITTIEDVKSLRESALDRIGKDELQRFLRLHRPRSINNENETRLLKKKELLEAVHFIRDNKQVETSNLAEPLNRALG